jgi:ubiquinone/menaquinone biosynthesis C-methylase UbiE
VKRLGPLSTLLGALLVIAAVVQLSTGLLPSAAPLAIPLGVLGLILVVAGLWLWRSGRRTTSEQAYARAINAHYGGADDPAAAILAALRAAGKDPERLAPDDLAPIDQFHFLGTESTLELARLAQLGPGMTVLDVGGGLGGPARTLAREFGCTVTVLDLTDQYCRVGELLTARTGLSDRVTFRQGDALAMPFPDAQFDVAWTQQAAMNIADKERWCAELHRVLRPGGRLALYEIMAGPSAPLFFPVPWAHDPALSFLRPPEEVRAVLATSGFKELAWVDVTARIGAARMVAARSASGALTGVQEQLPGQRSALAGPAPLGLQLLLGADFPAMARNVTWNFDEHRMVVIEAVFERP